MTFAVGCRRLTLPDGWKPVEDPMYETALRQTARAFASAAKNLKRYYDPEGGYSGATFLGVPSGDDGAVTAADLWAVSTLSMKVPPQHGRELLPGGSLADVVTSKLRSLPTDLDLPDATPDHLRTMGELQDAVRKGLPSLGKRADTNQWVFAAKLCARKRPRLFPVRDSKVCTYLAGNRRRGAKAGQLGWFSRDIQVFACLITHPDVRAWLAEARAGFASAPPDRPIDHQELRLLDVVLWMEATHGS